VYPQILHGLFPLHALPHPQEVTATFQAAYDAGEAEADAEDIANAEAANVMEGCTKRSKIVLRLRLLEIRKEMAERARVKVPTRAYWYVMCEV
jgi:hypothetical protein